MRGKKERAMITTGTSIASSGIVDCARDAAAEIKLRRLIG